MSKNNINTNEDMFGIDIPLIDPDGQMKPANSVEVKGVNSITLHIKENPIIGFSIVIVILIIFVILILLFKKFIKKRNPMLEYTKQQTKKLKKDQAYVSSTNKLETPDNLMDCIRAFIERTK